MPTTLADALFGLAMLLPALAIVVGAGFLAVQAITTRRPTTHTKS